MGTASGFGSNRSDNQITLQTAISYHFNSHWLVSGIVSYSKDFSNQAAFESLQNSLQLSYVF